MEDSGDLNSMREIAEFMRENLPAGMGLATFGKRMNWGRRNADARCRIATLTIEELRRTGLTSDQATNWATAYDAVGRIAPNNPSAAGRSELMKQAAKILEGE